MVGVTFSLIVTLTGSIPVHILGDLTFFAPVWPFDANRPIVWEAGPDLWFWIHMAEAIGFTVLAILAFRHLAVVTKNVRIVLRATSL
jgi:hypothetical protein